MALNYTRVGWEDAPSRNTPVDAANLNHMDNGILALSTAYDEDVPRLQEQVEDLASNIAANTIKEVLGNFAEVEDAPTATKNYAIGDYLVLNNHFYKATATVSSGDTLVEGTNIERTNVGAEVEENRIESSTNYCKMPDGTLIQWGKVSITTGTAAVPFGYRGVAAVTFAMTFVSLPAVITSPEDDGGYWNSGSNTITNTSFTASMAGNLQSVTKNVDWIAIGRWK